MTTKKSQKSRYAAIFIFWITGTDVSSVSIKHPFTLSQGSVSYAGPPSSFLDYVVQSTGNATGITEHEPSVAPHHLKIHRVEN